MLKIILPTGWSDILLAHMPKLQVLVSVVSPAHGCPPPDGVGLSQLRTRDSTPDPQVLLQWLQVAHAPQPPSTTHTTSVFKVTFLVCLLKSRIFHLLFPFWKFCYAPYYYNQTRASMANLHEMFFLSYSFRIFLFLNQYFTNFSTDYHAVIKPGINHFFSITNLY